MSQFVFSEENIQNLFGHEAAEDENFARLKEYYLKNKIFARITADLPLRILVGHKGIGKSALFKIAMAEDAEKGFLPILIQPNDIVNLQANATDFLQSIREWKIGLSAIIARKVLNSMGINGRREMSRLKQYSGQVVSFLIDTVKNSQVDMNPPRELVMRNFLKTHKVIVYVDDLDRGWLSTKEDITRISTLLNATRDMINECEGICFRIALRSDVYFLVRTSDESTDKIEGSVIWYDWTNHEILVMLAKRIETFWGREIDEKKLLNAKQVDFSPYLRSVMEPRFSGPGKWNNAPMYRILMSLIRKRPRDLVKLCTLAARQAYEDEAPWIETRHFETIFEEYSQGRIQDTINEYRSELPDIERLIMGMRPNRIEKKAGAGYIYTTPRLMVKLNNLIRVREYRFANGHVANAEKLANFLYKINFLTAVKELGRGEVDRKFFEENRYLSGHFADFGYDWEVHPAYRWALQPDAVKNIFNLIDLSVDS